MASIKQLQIGSTAYDIKAKYDIDDNQIATTYLKVANLAASLSGGAGKTVTGLTVSTTNGVTTISATTTNIAIGAGQITSGTLAVARGGTGRGALTGANSLRSDMGLGTETGALAIAYGGTGATNASGARAALGVHQIHYGTTAPAASLGEVGDIYVIYTA